jgi:hypothetical protein
MRDPDTQIVGALLTPEDGVVAKTAEGATSEIHSVAEKYGFENVLNDENSPDTVAPMLWVDCVDEYYISYRLPPSACVHTTLDGPRYVHALMEIWEVVEDSRENLQRTIECGYPLLANGSDSVMRHTGKIAHGNLVWTDDERMQNSILGMSGEEWPNDCVDELEKGIFFLLKEAEYVLTHPDPLWSRQFGSESPKPVCGHHLDYEVDEENAQAFPGGEVGYRKYLDERIEIKKMWEELCKTCGVSGKLLKPLKISLNKLSGDCYSSYGEVPYEVCGYDVCTPAYGESCLGSSRRIPINTVNMPYSEDLKTNASTQSLASHELCHHLTPYCPDNDILIEGVACLSQSLQKRMFAHEEWTGIQNLDGFEDLLTSDGCHSEHNLGDSVVIDGANSQYKEMHNCASAQALWEILEKNHENFCTLVSLMQSPVLDTSTVEAFTRDVDRYIPGFYNRFWTHPITKKAKSGPRLASMIFSGNIVISGLSFEYNENAGYLKSTHLPNTRFPYIWRRKDVDKFDRRCGEESGLDFGIAIAPADGGDWKIERKCDGKGYIVINFSNISKWAREQNIPDDKLSGEMCIHTHYFHDGKMKMADRVLNTIIARQK